MASQQSPMDEIFDDDIEEDQIAEKEWKRTENDMKKIGYRLGLEAGREESLQQAFNAGYATAARLAFAVGHLQGQISCSLNFEEKAQRQQEGSEHSGKLVTELNQLENDSALLQQSILNLQRTDTTVSPLHSHQFTNTTAFPVHSQFQNTATNVVGAIGNDDSLREVTEGLQAMDVQESSPMDHRILQGVRELQTHFDDVMRFLAQSHNDN